MPERTCSIDGCEKKVQTSGWCGMHYQRWKNSGDLGPPGRLVRLPARGAPCAIEGCDRETMARGWCDMHYQRWQRHGDPAHPGRRPRGICSVAGCGKPHSCHGLCSTHYRRWQRTGDPLLGGRKPPKGWLTPQGYVALHLGRDHPMAKPGGQCLEHRLVMSEMLGRPLTADETVHHINGIRSDNRPANLELWVNPPVSGQRVEDLAAWIVGQYPEFVEAAQAGRQQMTLRLVEEII